MLILSCLIQVLNLPSFCCCCCPVCGLFILGHGTGYAECLDRVLTSQSAKPKSNMCHMLLTSSNLNIVLRSCSFDRYSLQDVGVARLVDSSKYVPNIFVVSRSVTIDVYAISRGYLNSNRPMH